MRVRTTRKSNTKKVLAERIMRARHAAAAGASTAAETMRNQVRVRTGALKNSITETPVDENRTDVDVLAPHGIHNEFGTVKMPAKPFFRPGVEAGRGRMRQILSGKRTFFTGSRGGTFYYSGSGRKVYVKRRK